MFLPILNYFPFDIPQGGVTRILSATNMGMGESMAVPANTKQTAKKTAIARLVSQIKIRRTLTNFPSVFQRSIRFWLRSEEFGRRPVGKTTMLFVFIAPLYHKRRAV